MQDTVLQLTDLITKLISKVKQQKAKIAELESNQLSETQKAEIENLLRETKQILEED